MIKNLKPREIHSLAPNREIFAPDNGWVADTLYLVRVAHNRSNPVHDAYLQVGFLNDDGTPGSYTEVWCNTYDIAHELRHVHYLFPVRRLHTKGEASAQVEASDASETPPEDGVITTTDAEHARTLGNFCPKCGSADIEAGRLQADEGNAWSEVTCNGCGLEYQDTYALVGFNAG